ncbi:hypothetical protein [Streptomyces yaizuensis]|uniref:Uncharacterized protein n=1 Tax=Streptomyces yaizuensis TaxID=2989713 RepID=A0ABQ5P6N9_9ACTN|nr:hypothetical protein [Streptomyces sp. YSPA8]GLF98229.1 hypothetical protein SYYSPA8_28050 [Streptomyces sp. YSPA8]
MPPTVRLSANAVAVAAGVDSNWVYRAVAIGVLSEPHFSADIIVIRVYRLLSQFVWPDKPRQRSKKYALDTWQLTALHATRDAVTDPATTPETTLWVMQDSVRVANSREERAVLESASTDGLEASILDAQVALRLPIGRWIDELPAVLAATPRREPRRAAAAGGRTARRKSPTV